MLQGGKYVYHNYMFPKLKKHEQDIDKALDESKARFSDAIQYYWGLAIIQCQQLLHHAVMFISQQSQPVSVKPITTMRPRLAYWVDLLYSSPSPNRGVNATTWLLAMRKRQQLGMCTWKLYQSLSRVECLDLVQICSNSCLCCTGLCWVTRPRKTEGDGADLYHKHKL